MMLLKDVGPPGVEALAGACRVVFLPPADGVVLVAVVVFVFPLTLSGSRVVGSAARPVNWGLTVVLVLVVMLLKAVVPWGVEALAGACRVVFLPGNIGVVKLDDLVVAMSDPFTSVARDAGGLLLERPWSLSIGGTRVRRLRRRVVWVVCQGTLGVERCSSAGFEADDKSGPAEDGDNDQDGEVEVWTGLCLLDVKVFMRDGAGEEPEESKAGDVECLSDGSGGSSVEICVELEEGRRELDEGSFRSDTVSVEGNGCRDLVVWRCWDKVREGEVNLSNDVMFVAG